MDLTTAVHEINGQTINIFPNPTTDIIYILTDSSIDFKIDLYDIHGKHLLRQTSGQLDLSRFTNGVYLLSLTTNEGSPPIIERIVLSK